MVALLTHDSPRRATWFELFFDLVFVATISGLARHLAEHFDLRGVGQFAGLFLVLWWLWLGHTFHASRFDRDRPADWALGFAQMLAVVAIGQAAPEAWAARAATFAGGVAAFKALAMLGYLRVLRRPGLARLGGLYAAIYGTQAALWALSIGVEGPMRLSLWAMALALDFASPFLVARETYRAPPHPEHLPERFGLFTLILLGETAAAAIHALEAQAHPGAGGIAVAGAGAVLGALFWLGYFRRAKASAERHIADAAAGRRLRLWAFSHIPLYLGIVTQGAGTVHLAHSGPLHGAAGWIQSGAVALGMVGVTLISLATAGGRVRQGWAHFALAAVTLALPLGLHDAPALMAGLVILSVAQVALSVLRDRG